MKPVRIVLSFLVLASFLAAAGCNTTEGFGKDMSSAGRGLSREAHEHK